MPEIYLPESVRNQPVIQLSPTKYIVQANGRRRTIIIPLTGDPGHDKALREEYLNKTLAELRKMAPFVPLTDEQKKETAGALKDFVAWRNKKVV
jgi:hypothetical protein